MGRRNRSEGWTHAKLDGHALEDELGELIQNDEETASFLHEQCLGGSSKQKPKVYSEGIAAKQVSSVLGGCTSSKTDLLVAWDKNKVARISLKKSESGQVWLVTNDRFYKGYETVYGDKIPQEVKVGMQLFIGGSNLDAPISEILNGNKPLGPIRNKDGQYLEIHQKRLVAKTIETYFPGVWKKTLSWMRNNMGRIAEMCFSKGFCVEEENQAEFVWYYIRDGKNKGQTVLSSRIFVIKDIVNSINRLPNLERLAIGPRNGGSTLTLPFGFLQMHSPKGYNQMQFHHKIASIEELI